MSSPMSTAPKNLEFWLEARRRGSPMKIFPLPGSAVPPTAYEWGGGHFGYDEQKQFMAESLMVAGLDEVMDWPAVWNPENPSYDRLWGMIRATFEKRGVVEGHAAGIARSCRRSTPSPPPAWPPTMRAGSSRRSGTS